MLAKCFMAVQASSHSRASDAGECHRSIAAWTLAQTPSQTLVMCFLRMRTLYLVSSEAVPWQAARKRDPILIRLSSYSQFYSLNSRRSKKRVSPSSAQYLKLWVIHPRRSRADVDQMQRNTFPEQCPLPRESVPTPTFPKIQFQDTRCFRLRH